MFLLRRRVHYVPHMENAREFDVLLLDFGGVCLLNPVELHHKATEVLGLPEGSFQWLGPVDPSTDELWQDMIAGALTEREYWARRASEVGKAGGRDFDTRAYMTMLYEPARPELVRPEATETAVRAVAAGYGVSVLTNDMRAFHGREWEHDIDFLQIVDHIVDCSDTDILKPDPRAFTRAEELIGVSADRMLFVDDQPINVQGAKDFGIESMWFDISKAAESWHEVASRLGI